MRGDILWWSEMVLGIDEEPAPFELLIEPKITECCVPSRVG